jgi:hypothetical protein
MKVAEDVGRPIAVNPPTSTDSRTMLLAPRSWSQERLAGWVAGRRDELEAAFGEATPVDLGDL